MAKRTSWIEDINQQMRLEHQSEIKIVCISDKGGISKALFWHNKKDGKPAPIEIKELPNNDLYYLLPDFKTIEQALLICSNINKEFNEDFKPVEI